MRVADLEYPLPIFFKEFRTEVFLTGPFPIVGSVSGYFPSWPFPIVGSAPLDKTVAAFGISVEPLWHLYLP